MKAGLFFGSFNPVHNGHLAIARYMVENGGIDELWFVVSPQNPFKKSENLLDDASRYAMVCLAIKEEAQFRACDVELHLPKPSYTIDTLTFLKEQYPDDKFVIIIGADNYVHLPKWKEYEKLIGEYAFLIYPRPGFVIDDGHFSGNFTLVNSPLMDISSTEIRQAIAEKREVGHLLPPEVLGYIREHNLYCNQ